MTDRLDQAMEAAVEAVNSNEYLEENDYERAYAKALIADLSKPNDHILTGLNSVASDVEARAYERGRLYERATIRARAGLGEGE